MAFGSLMGMYKGKNIHRNPFGPGKALGTTHDMAMVVGDSDDGETGVEEVIVNPTGAPLAVIPTAAAKRLGLLEGSLPHKLGGTGMFSYASQFDRMGGRPPANTAQAFYNPGFNANRFQGQQPMAPRNTSWRAPQSAMGRPMGGWSGFSSAQNAANLARRNALMGGYNPATGRGFADFQGPNPYRMGTGPVSGLPRLAYGTTYQSPTQAAYTQSAGYRAPGSAGYQAPTTSTATGVYGTPGGAGSTRGYSGFTAGLPAGGTGGPGYTGYASQGYANPTQFGGTINSLINNQLQENAWAKGENIAALRQREGMIQGLMPSYDQDQLIQQSRLNALNLARDPEAINDRTQQQIINRATNLANASANARLNAMRGDLAETGQAGGSAEWAAQDALERDRMATLARTSTDLDIQRANQRNADIINATQMANQLGAQRANYNMGVSGQFLQSMPQYRPDDLSGLIATLGPLAQQPQSFGNPGGVVQSQGYGVGGYQGAPSAPAGQAMDPQMQSALAMILGGAGGGVNASSEGWRTGSSPTGAWKQLANDRTGYGGGFAAQDQATAGNWSNAGQQMYAPFSAWGGAGEIPGRTTNYSGSQFSYGGGGEMQAPVGVAPQGGGGQVYPNPYADPNYDPYRYTGIPQYGKGTVTDTHAMLDELDKKYA